MIGMDTNQDAYGHVSSAFGAVAEHANVGTLYSAGNLSSIPGVVIEFPSAGATSSVISVGKEARVYTALVERHEWLRDFFDNLSGVDSISKLAPIYSKINDLLMSKAFSEVDDILYCVDAKKCSDLLMLGLARITFSYRDQLFFWDEYRASVAKEGELRNLDKRSLIGLV
ncbi:hypothetical protein [Marinobacter xiaoshiensis]|uniref:Uncharacterized protein n=1 Tax=Marinobacter xiaoshiensis TaxID=3073652 RepID=A0ABU2HCV3_9GAMM|nr:hypothetical protein [Marinobacter sp. F60267]MDS1308867.1 hypothetical protein [Marinobacter sp. F60267]